MEHQEAEAKMKDAKKCYASAQKKWKSNLPGEIAVKECAMSALSKTSSQGGG
jgi:hypothetical protein